MSDDILRNLSPLELDEYNKCNPNKKDVTLKQLGDFNYIVDLKSITLDDTKVIRKLVEDDFEKKLKESGATKITSKNFKAKYWNKYHYIKHENHHIMYAMFGKKCEYVISHLERIITPRGSLYVFEVSDWLMLIHHHVFERYEERAGVASNDRLEAIKWVLKELVHAEFVYGDKIEHHRGFFLKDVSVMMASGVMLGNQIRNTIFVKTYVPLDMMNEYQDDVHKETWDRIIKDRNKLKRPAPII